MEMKVYGRLWQTMFLMSSEHLPLQASLKKFMDYIVSGSLDKISKVLDKGLDPNYHDPDNGGELKTSLIGLPLHDSDTVFSQISNDHYRY